MLPQRHGDGGGFARRRRVGVARLRGETLRPDFLKHPALTGQQDGHALGRAVHLPHALQYADTLLLAAKGEIGFAG